MLPFFIYTVYETNTEKKRIFSTQILILVPGKLRRSVFSESHQVNVSRAGK